MNVHFTIETHIYVRSMTSWHAGFLLPFPTVCFFFFRVRYHLMFTITIDEMTF